MRNIDQKFKEIGRKILLPLTITGLLSFVGCGGDPSNQVSKSKAKNENTIKGKPLSVQVVGGSHKLRDRSLSSVIETEDGKYIICNMYGNAGCITNTAALIESEINDGDSEFIEIIGYYKGEILKIETISANGYTLKIH